MTELLNLFLNPYAGEVFNLFAIMFYGMCGLLMATVLMEGLRR